MDSRLILPVSTNMDNSYYNTVGDVVFIDYVFSDSSKVLTTQYDCPVTGSQMPAEIVGVVHGNGFYELPPQDPQQLRQDRLVQLLLQHSCLLKTKAISLELAS